MKLATMAEALVAMVDNPEEAAIIGIRTRGALIAQASTKSWLWDASGICRSAFSTLPLIVTICPNSPRIPWLLDSARF